MSEPVDVASDDLAREPWAYPGRRPSHSGLLHAGRFLRMTVEEARRAAPHHRHLVVAVGSNASPAVMHRKLAREEVSTTVPFVRADVAGLRIGHSAHVSAPGYVAAAPVRDPAARTPVVAALLDTQQLECLDRTEPGYVRRTVTRDTCRLVLEGGESPTSFLMYVSRWGVLRPPGDEPLDLLSQERLYDLLRGASPGLAGLVGAGDHHAVQRRFAADAGLRAAAAATFREAGWVAPGGFEQDDGEATRGADRCAGKRSV